jgi:hypothetical protein
MRPKFVALALVTGAAKFTWLNALNNSPRNCSLMPARPGIGNSLETAMSVLAIAGPLIALFGTSP